MMITSVADGLLKRSSKYPVDAGDWCYLLWADEHVNPEAYHEGFCRNQLLLFVRVFASGLMFVAHYNPYKAARHILWGPRSTEGSPTRAAPTKPKAKIYNIRRITIPFIAYVAVMVRTI